MPKLKNYLINFIFQGSGWVNIKAESKEEAEEKFYAGEYDEKEYKETSDNYSVESVEEH